MVVKQVINLYLTPFKVYNDEKASRGPLYFLTASFWRDCGKVCRRNHVDDGQDNYDDGEWQRAPDIFKDLRESNEILLKSNQVDNELDKHLHEDEAKMIQNGTYESLANKIMFDGRHPDTLKLDRVEVKHGKHALVDDLSLTIFESEVFVFIGENGSGKTSVLQTMAGAQHVHSGSATAFGVNLFKDLRFLRKNLLAYSEQDVTVFGTLSVKENIIFMCKFLGFENEEEIAKKALADYDLHSCAHILANQISDVNKKKLSLAMTLISGAKVILLDAPTDGMNIAEKRIMWEMIKNRKKG